MVSRLELCGVKLTEVELLEKTFSTFHASNIVLQQQYRQRQFKTYSELISVLLTAEQTNELLLKNHDLRPAGSKAFPEANAGSSKNVGRPRGRERRHWNFFRKGGGRFNRNINNSPHNPKGKKPMKKHDDSTCHRCGMTGHWSRTCRTARHLVDLYQASQKDKSKHVETHAIDLTETNTEVNKVLVNEKPFEVSDFFL